MVVIRHSHSPAYRELIARLEASDWLIDQVVYRLYGLTEEEMSVVEGRGGTCRSIIFRHSPWD